MKMKYFIKKHKELFFLGIYFPVIYFEKKVNVYYKCLAEKISDDEVKITKILV